MSDSKPVRIQRRRTQSLNVRISASLRRRLEERRERSGRTLTGEVEACLRSALQQVGGDGLLLLSLDDGLMAHLEALARNGRGGMFGNLEQSAIYMLRTQIIDFMANDNLRELIAPHLREPYRKHSAEAVPIYRTLANPGQRRRTP